MNTRNIARTFALTGIIAGILNSILIIILDFTVPDYDFITQYVSEFGIIPGITSIIATTWWIINGLALIFFSFGLNASIRKYGRLSFLGPLFILMYGLFDSIGSAVFPMDLAEETFSGMMHILVSFIGITAFVFSPLALLGRIKRDQSWRRLVSFAWITQVFFWVVYIVCVLAFAEIYFDSYIGLLQRVFIYAGDIWLVVLGVKALKSLRQK